MKTFINFNGSILDAALPVIRADNRGYRYGDGVFETMKVWHGKILLEELHFERLKNSLQVLKIKLPSGFTELRLKDEILELCKKNNCDSSARVRLSVSRGNGGLYESNDQLLYLIECSQLEKEPAGFNEIGLTIGIYPDARKSIDAFSNLKSANFLPYAMAALYAKENKWDDCILLNSKERICDATIANVFIIQDGKLITPPLSEGCVAGVMRRKILESDFSGFWLQVKESVLKAEDLLNADEIFLTNAVSGIRWVKQLEEQTYRSEKTQKLFERLLEGSN